MYYVVLAGHDSRWSVSLLQSCAFVFLCVAVALPFLYNIHCHEEIYINKYVCLLW